MMGLVCPMEGAVYCRIMGTITAPCIMTPCWPPATYQTQTQSWLSWMYRETINSTFASWRHLTIPGTTRMLCEFSFLFSEFSFMRI
jgi:hypothetical protein